MSAKLTFFTILGSSLLLLLVLDLVRRRYLKERYALLWIVTGSLFLLLSIRTDLLHWIASLLGFLLPSNALFVLGFVFFLLIILALTAGLAAWPARAAAQDIEIGALLGWNFPGLDTTYTPSQFQKRGLGGVSGKAFFFPAVNQRNNATCHGFSRFYSSG